VEWVAVERALERMTYGSEVSLLRHLLSLPSLQPGRLHASGERAG